MDDEWLRVGEVAKLLDISTWKTRRLMDAGKIPSRTFMSEQRYAKRSDVEALAAELGIDPQT